MKIKELPFGCGDKEKVILVGKHLKLSVDYDDVDHDKVDEAIKKMIKVLKEHLK